MASKYSTNQDSEEANGSPGLSHAAFRQDSSQSQVTSPTGLIPHPLNWKEGQHALKEMSAPISAVVIHGDTAYFRQYRSREIYSFNCESQEWKRLPDCRVLDTSLVALPVTTDRWAKFALYTIGGIKRKHDRKHKNIYTNALFQLQLDEKAWIPSDTYPEMITERSQVTVVYTDQMLIAAGGRNSTGVTAVVEVLYIISNKWCRIANLPRGMFRASGCVCQQRLFILGGYDIEKGTSVPLNDAYEVDLDSLELACTALVSSAVKIDYKPIKPIVYCNSTIASIFGFILAIGGSEQVGTVWISSSKVYSYHPLTQSWHLLSNTSLLEKRSFPFSVTFGKGDSIDIAVVGGYTTKPDVDCTGSMEIATLTTKYLRDTAPFLMHPKDVSSKPGHLVKFSVESCLESCSYQWYFKERECDDSEYEGTSRNCLIINKCLPKHKGGEPINKDEANLLGNILENVDLSGSGVDIKDLLDGNNNKLTYEEMQCVLENSSVTGILSLNLKEELQTKLQEEQLYLEAIASEKKVTLSYTKIVTLGPGQVGKSTFLYRLLGLMKGNIETAPLETQPNKSTGQAELREVCIKHTNITGAVTTKQTWEVCEFEKLVTRLVHKEVKPESNSSTRLSETTSTTATVTSTEKQSQQSVDNLEVSAEMDPLLERRKDNAQPTTCSHANQMPKERCECESRKVSIITDSASVNSVIQEYKQYLRKWSPDTVELRMIFNIADVGGQPAFLDMLPLLTIGPALYLLFSKLVDDQGRVLDMQSFTSVQPVKYRSTTDKDPKMCHGYTYSTEEVLLSMLSSVACFGLPDKEVENYVTKKGDQQVTSSLVVMFGTFADKINLEKNELLSNLESALKDLLKKTRFYEESLINFPNPKFKDHHPDQVFFRINNKSGTVEEIIKYRSMIEELIETKFRMYDIPAPWLGLALCMRILAKNKDTYKVSLNDCFQIGSHFNMNEEMVKAALRFLHKYIGLVMYFPNNEYLQDLVICNPQVVFSSVSELTFNVYDSTSREEKLIEESLPQKRFEHKGIFSIESVAYKQTSESLSILELVELLKHLNIAAEIPFTVEEESLASSSEPKQKEFFFPAVLKTLEISSLTKNPELSNMELHPEPLCIRFQTGYVPMGFSCALIAKLMAHKKFKLLTDQEILYKNKLQFQFDGEFMVTVFSLPLRCEFHVTRHFESGSREFYDQDCCPEIMKIICRTTDIVLKSIQKTLIVPLNNNYDLAFKCPLLQLHQKVQLGHEPLAKFIYNDSSQTKLMKLECFKCNATLPDLTPEMKIWFGECPIIPLQLINQPTLDKNEISITAKGTNPLTYQWLLDDSKLIDNKDYSGVTTSTLVIQRENLLAKGCYMYSCEVTDISGKTIQSDRIDLFAEEVKHHGFSTAYKIEKLKGAALSIEDLKRKYEISDYQLNSMIEETQLYDLAGCFDNVESYMHKLGLSAGQRAQVEDLAERRDIQTATAKALEMWRQPNPLTATFRALLEILLDLRRGDVAVRMCQYVSEDVPKQKS